MTVDDRYKQHDKWPRSIGCEDGEMAPCTNRIFCFVTLPHPCPKPTMLSEGCACEATKPCGRQCCAANRLHLWSADEHFLAHTRSYPLVTFQQEHISLQALQESFGGLPLRLSAILNLRLFTATAIHTPWRPNLTYLDSGTPRQGL